MRLFEIPYENMNLHVTIDNGCPQIWRIEDSNTGDDISCEVSAKQWEEITHLISKKQLLINHK